MKVYPDLKRFSNDTINFRAAFSPFRRLDGKLGLRGSGGYALYPG